MSYYDKLLPRKKNPEVIPQQAKRGDIGYDNPRDDIEKIKNLREGTIVKVPANDLDIVNKKYVDDEIAPYEKLDGTNQPATGNKNISKDTPEDRLTDTAAGGDYSRKIQSGTTATQKARVKNLVSNYAIHYDGTNNYIKRAGLNTLGAASFSISFWVYHHVTGDGHFFSKRTWGGAHNVLLWAGWSAANQFQFQLYYDGTQKDLLVNITAADFLNHWKHLVFRRELNGNMTLYIDGVSQGAGTATGATTFNSTVDFAYGCQLQDAAPAAYSHVVCNDLAIWEKHISANCIADLYNAGAGFRFTSATNWPTDGGSMGTNLTAYWKMNEGTGIATTADSSGNGNDATMVNIEAADWVTGFFPVTPTISEIDVWKAKDATVVCDGEIDLGKASVKLNLLGIPMLPSYTTTLRDALTASNGMIIYNSTTNAINGYENGAWIDL